MLYKSRVCSNLEYVNAIWCPYKRVKIHNYKKFKERQKSVNSIKN